MDALPASARWIWLAGADQDVDCHVLLRRVIHLHRAPDRAPAGHHRRAELSTVGERRLHRPRPSELVRWAVKDGRFDCHVRAPGGVPVEVIVPAGLVEGRISVE